MTRLLVSLVAVSTIVGPSFLVAAPPDIPAIERRLPPAGMPLPTDLRRTVERRMEQLRQRLAAFKNHPLQADVAIYLKAVDFALVHDEFYSEKDFALPDQMLHEAERRVEQLENGGPAWPEQRGLLVRGYTSRVDGSAQPYGLEIPEQLDLSGEVPLYVWLHGRGDKATDLHFIHQRQTRPGTITASDAIVVHPFGRQCVGFKSAGEVDVLEAVEDVCRKYSIDRDRVVLMGFSMGGAGCWQIGAHYTDQWAAMSPGAGFAETARYNRLQRDDYPAWYEQKLWGMYDVPDYVRNLFNLPVVAYSGEMDRQIQAARVMEEAYQGEGRRLPHLIGPGMGHKYHPDTLREILDRMRQAVAEGRPKRPERVTLQTRTLRYNRMHWVEALELARHWEDSRVDAQLVDNRTIRVETKNVARLRLSPGSDLRNGRVTIDGHSIDLPAGDSSYTQIVLAADSDGRWQLDDGRAEPPALVKRPGLQGPIDDALVDAFLVVTPSGTSNNASRQRWIDFELEHFQDRWMALMRGRVRSKPDREVTAEDIEQYHLILWGDADSNRLIRRLLSSDEPLAHRLPLVWTADTLQVGQRRFDAEHQVPLLIYPNPLNPQKYVVINSGLTFREQHDRTNSLQNPKLPDWAILDLRQLPDGEAAGRVVEADFFDEHWQLQRPHAERTE